MNRTRAILVAVLVFATLVVLVAAIRHDGAGPPRAGPLESARTIQSVIPPAVRRDAKKVRYVALGGGATPESTEVSLEQDLQLARQVLGPEGLFFFAGGRDTQSVRVERGADQSPNLLIRIGEIFQPRTGRFSRYRTTQIDAEPAVVSEFERQLGRILKAGSDRITLFVASHGERGESPRDAFIPLWGGGTLTVPRLAELHARHPRPLRVVVAACFSGGFAELAFENADHTRGKSSAPRCGLFAGTWDRPTSGCDPDPDRRSQEGYSLHVLHALRAQDRHGKRLSLEELDYDRDGQIGWLDAHTRARIASTSIDVPTTTSERFLRAVQSDGSAFDEQLLPEESAVIAQLGDRLGIDDETGVRRRLQELDARLGEQDEELARAAAALDRAAKELGSRLLERWPVLDDAYHPEFAATLKRSAAAIARVLDDDVLARAYRDAGQRAASLEKRYSDLEVEEAMVERMLRAYETIRLATALSRRGGSDWQYYERLITCERGAP